MYLAGIRCEACHNRPQADHQAANEVSCMACHGPKYFTIYRSWQAGLKQRLDALRSELQTVTARLAGRTDGADSLADAKANFALLEQGKPIHNPGYAVDLFAQAHRDLGEALSAAGDHPIAAPPWTEAPYKIACLRCHIGVELQSGNAFGKAFSHTPHVTRARLRCTACHGDLDNHGTLRLGASDCTTCHERITHPMAGLTSEQCLGCHTADIGPVSDQIIFPHEKHVAAGLDCEMCHTGVADQRHKEFAHSSNALPKRGHEFCGTCHGSDVLAADGSMPEGANCSMCHVGS
jgi:hypothetical protein